MRGQSSSLVWPATPLVVTGSTLLNGLQVYYKLENLNDSVGGLTLTDHGTVTFPAGKVNNAASFASASSQYLSRADNAAFQMGTGDFTVAGWVKTSPIGLQSWISYGDFNSGAGYWILQSGAGAYKVIVQDAGGAHSVNVEAGTVDTGWHLVILDAARSGNLTLYLDNSSIGTPVSMASVGSVNSTLGFAIGCDPSATPSFYADALIDEVGLWNRSLTSTERSAFWNGGAGTTHPF